MEENFKEKLKKLKEIQNNPYLSQTDLDFMLELLQESIDNDTKVQKGPKGELYSVIHKILSSHGMSTKNFLDILLSKATIKSDNTFMFSYTYSIAYILLEVLQYRKRKALLEDPDHTSDSVEIENQVAKFYERYIALLQKTIVIKLYLADIYPKVITKDWTRSLKQFVDEEDKPKFSLHIYDQHIHVQRLLLIIGRLVELNHTIDDNNSNGIDTSDEILSEAENLLAKISFCLENETVFDIRLLIDDKIPPKLKKLLKRFIQHNDLQSSYVSGGRIKRNRREHGFLWTKPKETK